MYNPAPAIPPQLLAEITQERIALRDRGQELGAQKDQLLINGGNIPPGLIVGLFMQIRDIIQHDINRRVHLSTAQRRSNLGNIVISVHLLLSLMDLNAYDNRALGYEGCNIWRMLRFLTKFNLPIHIPGMAPIYQISDGEVTTLLDNDITNQLSLIVTAEINVLQPPLPPPAGIFHPVNYLDARTNARDTYRNHRLLTNLTRILTQAKELEQLDKAIAAINHIQACAPLLNDPNPNTVIMTKKDILYSLVVIGETVTKKNLTPQTANLIHPLFAADGIRKLLISLANKITHNEWDIHPRNIEICLANNYQNILNEMPALLAIFTQLRTQLAQIIQNGTQNVHYQQVIPGGGPNPLPVGNALTVLHTALAGTGQTAQQDRGNHPGSFTSETMSISINDEGTDLALIDDYRVKYRVPAEVALNAMRYQLSRIAKFLQVIEENGDIQIEALLGGNFAEQYRQFRNYMRHGNDLMEIIDPAAERQFLINYANLIRHHVYPALESAFLPPPSP